MILDADGIRVSGSVSPEEGGEAGAEVSPGSRQRGEDDDVRMRLERGLDEGVKAADALIKFAELAHEGMEELSAAFESDGVSADGHGFCDECEAYFDGLGTPGAVLVVELLDGGWAGPLQGLQGGPLLEEGEGKAGVEIASRDLEGLGKAILEDLGETICGADAQVDELPALLSQDGELP